MDFGLQFVAKPSRRLDNVRRLRYLGADETPLATATQAFGGPFGYLGALLGLDQGNDHSYEVKDRRGTAVLRAKTWAGWRTSPSRTQLEAPIGTPFGALVVVPDGGLVFELSEGHNVGRLVKAEEAGGRTTFHVLDERGDVAGTVITGEPPAQVQGESVLDLAIDVSNMEQTGTSLPPFRVTRLQIDLPSPLAEPLATFVAAIPIAVCLGYDSHPSATVGAGTDPAS